MVCDSCMKADMAWGFKRVACWISHRIRLCNPRIPCQKLLISDDWKLQQLLKQCFSAALSDQTNTTVDQNLTNLSKRGP